MSVDIIAEVGINHDGNYEKAVRMIGEVAKTGVKIAKFQKYDPLKLLGPLSPYLAYATQCQFSYDQLENLKRMCDALDLEFLVSVFDVKDVPWANALCKRHKVASRMNQDADFLRALLNTGKELIVSTQSFTPALFSNVRYMYCVTEYPTPLEKMKNLPCSKDLGLSSHCPSIAPSLQAVSHGAALLEHHVTYSRNDPGCDQTSSITFDELKQLNLWANEMAVIR